MRYEPNWESRIYCVRVLSPTTTTLGKFGFRHFKKSSVRAKHFSVSQETLRIALWKAHLGIYKCISPKWWCFGSGPRHVLGALSRQ